MFYRAIGAAHKNPVLLKSLRPDDFDAGPVELDESVPPERLAEPRLVVHAYSRRLSGLLPSVGHEVPVLPFFVGRVLSEGEPRPPITVDFMIRDEPPYRLSSVHFAVFRENGVFFVRDFATEHGTEVNGRVLGGDLARCEAEPLRRGDNYIVAGGAGSPYVFRFRLDWADTA